MDIRLINTQKVLVPTQMTLAPYAINPYRGCEFGCCYCYTRLTKTYSHNALGIKINAPSVLEKELRTKRVEKVVLGSNCECFTYAETKYRISAKILDTLNRFKINSIILTKSCLIQNYLPLIKKNKNNRIFFTFNFSSEKIKALLEGSSPSLEKRRITIEKIVAAGIPLRLHIGPFIPFFSNLEDIFAIFKDKINEMNIELYHSKMGNFNELILKIKSFDKRKTSQLEHVYKNEDAYNNFALSLKKKASALNRKYNYRLYFIIPKFGNFYDSTITYE